MRDLWVPSGFFHRAVSCDALEPRRLLAAGDLDPSFGVGGRVLGSATLGWVGIASPLSADVAVDSAGRTVLAGTTVQQSDGRSVAFVARFNRDGSLDDSFSKDGLTLIDFGGRGQSASAVSLDAAGRIVVGATVQGARRSQFGFARLDAGGALDTSFSADGLFLIDFGADGKLNDIAVDAGNRIIAAGSVRTGAGGSSIGVARVNPSGRLDATFDGNGINLIDASRGHDSAEAIALSGDRIYLGGTTSDGTANFAALRLRLNGSLDRTFDGNGISAVDFAGGQDDAMAILVDSGGRVVLAGFAGGDTAVARLTSGGAVDSSFSQNGRTDQDELFPGQPLAGLTRSDFAEAVQARPQLLAQEAGYRVFSGNAEIRLTTTGEADVTFGNGGIRGVVDGENVNADLAGLPFIRSVVSDGTGIAAARNLDRNGYPHPDPIPFYFGAFADRVPASGMIADPDRHEFIPVSALATSVIAADGRLFVSGSYGKGSVVQAYKGDGRIDRTFAGRGFRFDATESNIMGTWTLLPKGDGSLLTRYGAIQVSDNDPIAIVLRSLRPDGSFDPDFDDFDSADETSLVSLTAQPRGSLTFSYGTTISNQDSFFLKRAEAPAALVLIPLADPSSEEEGPDGAAAIAGSNKYFATGHFREGSPVSTLKRALVRLNEDGTLDASFADNGVLRDFTGTVLWGQTSLKPLYTLPGASGLRRLNNDGTVDRSFGINGIAASGFTNFDIDSEGRIIAFREIRSGVADGDVQVMRLTINGKIDTTFGGGDGLMVVDTRLPSAATPNLMVAPNDDLVITSRQTVGGDVLWSATRVLGA